jgi:hypothetical protein
MDGWYDRITKHASFVQRESRNENRFAWAEMALSAGTKMRLGDWAAWVEIRLKIGCRRHAGMDRLWHDDAFHMRAESVELRVVNEASRYRAASYLR